MAFTNTQAPELPHSVAGLVQGVLGLDDLALPRPLALRRAGAAPAQAGSGGARPRVVTGGPQPCSTASSAAASMPITYTADQIASAYGFSKLYEAGEEGAGVTVGVLELEGNFPSDIAAFQQCYGTNASVSYVSVDGGPPPPDASNFDGLETELDVEQVIGMAPRANVLVYQAPNTEASNEYDVESAMVSQDLAQVISISWGLCEPFVGAVYAHAENTLFEEAAVQGQTVDAVSGDTGSEDCYWGRRHHHHAGGRRPRLAAVRNRSRGNVADGARPPTDRDRLERRVDQPSQRRERWRHLAALADAELPVRRTHLPERDRLELLLEAMRLHIGLLPGGARCLSGADPFTGVAIYWDGDGTPTDESAWQGIGGTSAAAPLWGALMALTDGSSACAGTPIGFADPALYRAAATEYSSAFNDVTSGNNDYTGSNGGLFPAGPGYDMATGLGTPVASTLAASLCALTVRVSNPGPQTSGVGIAAQLQIKATDSPGKTLSYSAAGLPPGLAVTPSTGLVLGTPTTAGTYPVTVTVTDNDGASTSAQFAWTVEPVAGTVSSLGAQTGTVGAPIQLQVHARSGNGGALGYSATGLPPGLSISPTSGLIVGKPTAAGTYAVTVVIEETGSYPVSTAFRWTIFAPPTSSHDLLSGIAKGKPRLAFTLLAGPQALPIKAISIVLPAGLRLSKKELMMISVKGARNHRLTYTARLRRGVLALILTRATTQIGVVIASPPLTAGGLLVQAVSHRHIRALVVVVEDDKRERDIERTAAEAATVLGAEAARGLGRLLQGLAQSLAFRVLARSSWRSTTLTISFITCSIPVAFASPVANASRQSARAPWWRAR